MRRTNSNTGFTLIEVLISMLILAVGLLGLAGMQATGLRNNLSAFHRTQATQLAYDLADRMRANIADAGLYIASTYFTVAPGAAATTPGCTTTAGCTAAQMAQQDLNEWNNNLTVLPLATGTVGVAANIYTITIRWDDDRDDLITAADPNFTMSFQL